MDDQLVRIPKGTVQSAGNPTAHGGFPAGGHTDQHHVLFFPQDSTINAVDPTVVCLPVKEAGGGINRLRAQHIQPALGRKPQFSGRLHQACGQRIVHHVHHALQCRKTLRLQRTAFYVGKHAHRRGVDDHLRVGMKQGNLLIGAKPFATVPGNQHNLPGAHVLRHSPQGLGGAASAQNQYFSAGNFHPRVADQRRRAGIIGVVTVQPPISVYDGVHRADLPGPVGNFVQQRDHQLLIGDGDVQAPESAFFQQLTNPFRAKLPKLVGIMADLGMNFRGKAVPQLRADQAVFQPCFHQKASLLFRKISVP